MSQVFANAPSTEKIRDSRPKFLDRDEALRSEFSGESPPTDPTPVEGQRWLKPSTLQPYRYIGGQWIKVQDVISAFTVADLKAREAAETIPDGTLVTVWGYTAFGDVPPFSVQWDADATDTADDLLIFRPTAGAASSGAGRWVRPSPSLQTTFADSDSSPTVKHRTYFKTASASPSISAFDDGYKGQQIIVERGAIDCVIADNANIDCGGRSLRLTASFKRAHFYMDDAGVWRLLTPRTSVLNVKVDFGAKGDGRIYAGVAITNGANSLVCAGATFTSADVGKAIWIEYAAAGGAPLVTTVSGFTNSTTVTLTANAGTTVSNAIAVVKIGTDDTAAIDAALAALDPKGQKLFFPHGTYLYSGTSGLVIGDGSTSAPSTTTNIELEGENAGTFDVLKNNVNGTAIEYFGSTVADQMLFGDGPIRLGVRNLVFNATRRANKIWNLSHVFCSRFDLSGAMAPATGGTAIYLGAIATDNTKTFIGAGSNVFEQCFASTVGALTCVALQLGQDAFVAGFDPATCRFNYCTFSVSDDTNATSWTAFNRVATVTTSTCVLLRFTDNVSFDGCFTYVSGQRRGNGVLVKAPSGSGNAFRFPMEVRMSGCHHVGGIWVDNTDNTWNPDSGDGVVRGLIIVAGHFGDASDPNYAGAAYPPYNIAGVTGFTDSGEMFGAMAHPAFSSGVAATYATTATNTADAASVAAGLFEGNRATPTAGDAVYYDMKLSDSAGNQDVFARVLCLGTSVTSTAEVGALRFSLMSAGALAAILDLAPTALKPVTNDGVAIGTASLSFSDLFLASGGVINWANGDFTLTHSSGLLTAAGQVVVTYGGSATTAAARLTNTNDAALVLGLTIEGDRATPANSDGVYQNFRLSNLAGTQTTMGRIIALGTTLTNGAEYGAFRFSLVQNGTMTAMLDLVGSALYPVTNDLLALGTASFSFSDLFLASGAVVNFANGDVTITHSSHLLTFAAGQVLYTYGAAATTPAARFRNSTDATPVQAVSYESARATPTAFDGVYMDFKLNNASPAQVSFGRVICFANAITAGSEDGALRFSVINAGTMTGYLDLTKTKFGPISNDLLPLGTAAAAWSDLFLASGGVINFAASDFTITHATGKITLSGDLFFATGKRIDFQNSQSTVGAAGAATALPALPTGYVPIKVGGTEFVVPYYAKT